MRNRLPVLLALAAAFIATPAALAQALQVSVTASGLTSAVSSGGAATLTATDVGQPLLASVTVRYTGTASAVISGVSVTGTSEISLLQAPAFPVTLNPNSATAFSVQYVSTSGNPVAAQVSIVYSEGGPAAGFGFTLSGISPRLAYSYTLFPSGTVSDLNPGDRITFPGTNVGGTATAVVNVLNRGSAVARLQSLALTGTSFQVTAAQIPAQVPPGGQVSFNVAFAPQAAGSAQGAVLLMLASTSVSFPLTGTGTTQSFTVTYALADGNVQPLADGSLISFSGIDSNATATAGIDIVNQGTGSGTVNSVSVSGTAYRLSGVPLLPATVAAGQSLHLSLVFAPTQVGSFNGTLRIDLGGRTVTAVLSGSTNAPSFSISYTLADGIAHPVSGGTTISLPSVDINGTSSASIEIANQGAGAGTITGINATGTAFRVTGAPLLPAKVPAGQSVRFTIVFAPTDAGSFNGTFRIDLTGSSISGALSASTAASKITLSYIDPDTNNILPLSDGATLPFPNTAVGSNVTLTLVLANGGAGTGTVNTIAVNGSAGAAFQMQSLPALPVMVPPSQQVRFGVRFAPQQRQAFSAALALNVNGQSLTVQLQALGTAPQFTYSYGSAMVTAGGTIALSDTNVGETSSVTVGITNSGSADGQVTAIAVTGQGLTVSDLPALPFTLHTGASQHFTLNFAPSQPGAVSGRVTLGGDTLLVSATGIGPRLIFSYSNGGAAVTVAEGGVLIFPPLEVGSSATLNVSVQNTGTSAAIISSINLAGTVFKLPELPALPMNLASGATITFPVSFAPNTTGSLTGALRVNNSSFTVSGTGIQPAMLPAYQFQAPSLKPQPAQQPAIGLTLAAPYSSTLEGTLKLSFVSAVFAEDPAIQFASGGRTVAFTIPANSTQALFNGSTSIALQTGTTAVTIVLTPSFAMEGGFDVTPSSPDTLTLTIARAAPALQGATISSQTLTSFSVVLSGYCTSRALRTIDIDITPKQGQSFTVTHLSLEVSAASSSWFQSAASQGTGGSFVAAIPFILQNGNSTDDLVGRIQSLTITATNESGTSAPITVAVR